MRPAYNPEEVRKCLPLMPKGLGPNPRYDIQIVLSGEGRYAYMATYDGKILGYGTSLLAASRHAHLNEIMVRVEHAWRFAGHYVDVDLDNARPHHHRELAACLSGPAPRKRAIHWAAALLEYAEMLERAH
jgi:hypothetical protein